MLDLCNVAGQVSETALALGVASLSMEDRILDKGRPLIRNI